MLLPYLDILDPERQKVFKLLKHFSRTFVLAGGTAIMLQIGHRLSYDFDCFSEKPLPRNTDKMAYDIFGKASRRVYSKENSLIDFLCRSCQK